MANDIAPGAVKAADLAGDVKPKAFAFAGPADADTSDRHMLTKLGDLKLTLGCNIPAAAIKDVKVVTTIVGGRVVYQR